MRSVAARGTFLFFQDIFIGVWDMSLWWWWGSWLLIKELL